MSKTGQWVLEMQEDAWELTRDEFIAKHGEHNVDVWDSENRYEMRGIFQVDN